MEIIDLYNFCPNCSGKFKKVNIRSLVCKNCGYKQYVNPVPCNGVIIENGNNQILLAKRKIDPKKGYWDLPGGFIEPGESFENSVKREIKEELGVDIKILKIVGVYSDTYLYENINYPTLGIVVTAKLKSFNLKSADDISAYKFFDKKDVLKQKLAFVSLRKSLEDYLKNNL